MSDAGRVFAVDVRTEDSLVLPHSALLRTVVELSVAGFDLELPGEVAGPARWTQQRSALLPETTTSTPLGRIRLMHRASPSAMGLVRIDTDGGIAWLRTGRAFAEDYTVKGTVDGVAVFDTVRGVLLSREWTANVAGASFVHVGRVELMGPEPESR